MEDFDILKAIAGLISALSTIAVYKLNVAQSHKVRAELLERLEVALSEGRKHATCELFRMLHGLRVDYEDIRTICSDDRVSKIVLALQKTPGIVKHEGGKLQYTKLYGNRWVRRLDRLVMRFFALILGILTIAMIVLMATLDGVAAVAILVFAIPCVVFLAMQLKDLRHDRMVESLVNRAETS